MWQIFLFRCKKKRWFWILWDCHIWSGKDRTLCFSSGLKSIGCLVPKKSGFYDIGEWLNLCWLGLMQYNSYLAIHQIVSQNAVAGYISILAIFQPFQVRSWWCKKQNLSYQKIQLSSKPPANLKNAFIRWSENTCFNCLSPTSYFTHHFVGPTTISDTHFYRLSYSLEHMKMVTGITAMPEEPLGQEWGPKEIEFYT